ncbi:S-layer homology domain-containing protein [Tissierellaceae bacterium HCP3S3_D8]
MRKSSIRFLALLIAFITIFNIGIGAYAETAMYSIDGERVELSQEEMITLEESGEEIYKEEGESSLEIEVDDTELQEEPSIEGLEDVEVDDTQLQKEPSIEESGDEEVNDAQLQEEPSIEESEDEEVDDTQLQEEPFTEELEDEVVEEEKKLIDTAYYEIHYIIKETEELVPSLEPVLGSGEVGEKISISHPEVKGYKVLENQIEELIISEEEEDNKVVIYYEIIREDTTYEDLIVNHILVSEDGEEVVDREIIEGLAVGDTVYSKDFVSQDRNIIFVKSEPEELIIGEGENIVSLYYEEMVEEEFEIGDNPDGLDSPEYIDAPNIYYPSSFIEVPKMLYHSQSKRSLGVMGYPGDYNNIEPPAPGSLDIKKYEKSVEGKSNQWKITLELTGENLPINSDIVLVIDRSGSMRDNRRMESAKESAREFIHTLLKDSNTTTRIAIVSFAGDIKVDSKFKGAKEKKELLKAIDNLYANGGTFTQAGIKQARELLRDSKADYKNIVLLSDGEPTYSYKIKNIENRLNSQYFKDGIITDIFGIPREIKETKDDLDEAVYNYNPNRETAGDGTSMHTRINLWPFKYYYNHGNSAIAESRYAKDENITIYSIGLSVDRDGRDVLEKVASTGKYYTANPNDLNKIFKDIAGSIAYAATDVTITDPIGEKFSIPGINSINYESKINVDRGTILWDDDTETITWKLETISKNNPAKMWYIVEIDNDVNSKKVYPTNGHTYVEYTNALGVDAKKSFPVPEVGIDAGTIKIHYYRVNGNGEPINSKGEKIDKVDAELQVQTFKEGTDLELNAPYTISGPESVEINDIKYEYNPIGNVGDKNPTIVTLTTSQPNVHIWFAYREVKDDGNLTIKKVLKDASGEEIKNDEREFKINIAGPNDYNEIITLKGGESKTLSNLTHGKYTIFEEDPGEGFTVNIDKEAITLGRDNKDGIVTVTNTYVSPKTEVTVEKVWEGGPEVKPSIELQLYRGDEAYGEAVTLNNGRTEYTWGNLDLTDKDGVEYVYTVDEVEVPAGYEKEINGLKVINTAKSDLIVEIKYVEKGNRDNVLGTDTLIGTFKDSYEIPEKEFTGYTYESTDDPNGGEFLDPSQVVYVEYIKRTDISYIVNYLEKDTEKILADQKIITGKTFGEEITENAISIEGYNKLTPIERTIILGVEENVINFYYEKGSFEYKVEYYYDSKLDEDLTFKGMGSFGSEITEYQSQEKEGYKIDKVEGLPLVITTDKENNVIKVYYQKDEDKWHTIKFISGANGKLQEEDQTEFKDILDGTKWKEAVEVPEPIAETGYKFKDWTPEFPVTVTKSMTYTAEFEEASFDYKVEYYYADQLDEKNTEKGSALFGEVINSHEDKIKEGYKFDRVDGLPLTITSNVESNIIRVYYNLRDDISYTVKYVDNEGNKLFEDKEIKNQTMGTEITEEAIDIEGYTVDEATKSLRLAEKDNVITFVYTPIDYKLAITYKYADGSEAFPSYIDDKMHIGEEYSVDSPEAPLGYTVDRAVVSGIMSANNVIEEVIYIPNTDIEYTVRYETKDGTKLLDDRIVKNQTMGSTIEEKAEIIPGYTVDKEKKSLQLKADGNEIVFYYEIDQEQKLNYTVKYYKGEEVLEEVTDLTVLVADPVVNEVEDKTPAGYKLDEANSTKLPYKVTIEDNIITVYYVIDETQILPYIVEYYKDGEKFETTAGEVLLANPVVESVSYENMPVGYKVDAVKSTKFPFTIKADEDNNVIKVYYIPRTDIIYTVKYLKKGTNKELADEEVIFNQTYGARVTEKAKNISGYTVDKEMKSLTLKASGNEIIFYYTEKSTGSGGGGGSGGRDRDRDRDRDKKDKDKDKQEVIIIEEEIPQALVQLNREDHHQYIQGYPDNTVRPEGLVTREEVAAVFYRLLTEESRDKIRTEAHNFADVDYARWSNKHIATLAKGKIIEGYQDGSFRPGNNITRAELATIASRFDKLSPFESNTFSDIENHWANQYINSATQKGWVNGYPDKTFKPDQYITRAEFVTLVNNVLNRKVKKEHILSDARQFPDLLKDRWYYEPMQEAVNSHHYKRMEDNYEGWLDIYYPQPEM